MDQASAIGGELWAVTTYFNPAGYRTKLVNFRRFHASLEAQGVPLLVMELSYNNAYELDSEEFQNAKIIRIKAEDSMWQKERLCNMALGHLPSDCLYVAFLDADILFTNSNWAAETSSLLSTHQAVQPFSHAIPMPEGVTSVDPKSALDGKGEGKRAEGFAHSICHKGPTALKNFETHGHPGYVWAFQRKFIEQHGWYDRAILGGGDTLMAYALYGSTINDFTDNLPPEMFADYQKWAEPVGATVAGKVSYTSGEILHLWHGSVANRKYMQRNQILNQNRFDPRRDIERSAQGPWQWGTEKEQLHRDVANYFFSRNEDNQATTDSSAKVAPPIPTREDHRLVELFKYNFVRQYWRIPAAFGLVYLLLVPDITLRINIVVAFGLLMAVGLETAYRVNRAVPRLVNELVGEKFEQKFSLLHFQLTGFLTKQAETRRLEFERLNRRFSKKIEDLVSSPIQPVPPPSGLDQPLRRDN